MKILTMNFYSDKLSLMYLNPVPVFLNISEQKMREKEENKSSHKDTSHVY